MITITKDSRFYSTERAEMTNQNYANQKVLFIAVQYFLIMWTGLSFYGFLFANYKVVYNKFLSIHANDPVYIDQSSWLVLQLSDREL